MYFLYFEKYILLFLSFLHLWRVISTGSSDRWPSVRN